MPRSKKNRPETYDIEYVRAAAARQWPAILTALGGIDPDLLDGKHHPCPKCQGTDRFRLIDADAGAVLCNQCFNSNNGDGFAALQWVTGWKFVDALKAVADYLGIQPSSDAPRTSSKGPSNPAEHLAFEEWDDGNEMLAAAWCTWKEPISVAAIKAVGGRIARYRQQYLVLALPVWGKQLDAADPVGWIIYNLAGGNLPKYAKNSATGKWEISEWVKVKLTAGSQPGVVADLARLRTARVAIKVEGPSDLLAMLSLADLPDDHAALTNANGAGERPHDWMLDLFASKESAWVVHDADQPGQAGAVGRIDEKSQQFRPGWANYLADRIPTRNVVLPFPIVETHGQDLRDYLNLPSTFADLQALAAAAEQLSGGAKIGTVVLEAEDDPHRLARVNLEKYAELTGGTIRYWRQEWYTWKPDRACYQKIDDTELRAKIGASVKLEFDRLNLIEQKESESDKPPIARKVTTQLVNNVVNATAGMQIVPYSVEPMTWLSDNGERSQHNFVSVRNGILDLDRLLADHDDCILPHSPNWFSTVCLPYNFDPTARCPQWEAFLEKSLEGDVDRINILQEWAGYCLMPDTSQQKFLAMEGEGGNGKSVFMAGLQAIIGPRNCSNIGLECLARDGYDASETYGKLVNICADVGEIDKISEGNLKSFTSGDVMSFRRKFLGVLTVKPTARLVLAFNKRPRFHDPTDGVWRRMLLVPWRIQIAEDERVYGMDSIDWWNRSGELSGMFNWALRGLFRLRNQGRFTHSEIVTEAVADYKDEANPCHVFLKENFEFNASNVVSSNTAYGFYCKWAEKNGYKQMNERTFGKEIKRVFPKIERKKGGTRTSRFYFYQGLAFSQDEICGEKTSDDVLFD